MPGAPERCRNCGVELPRDLALMGICAWCIAASLQRPALEIPTPRYGPDGDDDADSQGEFDFDAH